MRHGAWADDLEGLRAASWDGLIRARDLVRLGVPERTVYRRTQEDGPWTLLLPATILLSNGAPTRHQLEIAALLYAGRDAVITGLGGARHHGITRGEDPTTVHVLVPLDRQVTSAKFVVVERTRRLPTPLDRDGLPVASLARCLIDECRRLKDTNEIAALLTQSVQKRMLQPETLQVELDRASRKGTAAPRRVLEGIDAGVWSPAEFDARELWESTGGLPEARWNVALYDLSGVLLGIVDAFVEELGFAWEIDSVEEHFATPDQVQATAERRRRLQGAGLHVVSTRPSQRRDDPDGVRHDIRAGLEIARLLPAPRVTIYPAAA